jgi:signal transduction histidine kinase
MPGKHRQFWHLVRGLSAPVLLWVLFLGVLASTIQSRLHGGEEYDRAAIREWIDESRVFRQTLPELVRDYLKLADEDSTEPETLTLQSLQIHEQLKALADPTKMYQGQLPLFPAIYRLELDFPGRTRNPVASIVWESEIPRPRDNLQVVSMAHPILGQEDRRAVLHVEYQLHAFNKRQRDEQAATFRLRWISGLATVATALAFLWIYLVQERERERENRRLVAQQKIDQAERLALEHQLQRQEAERHQEETERKLLEQHLATQAAEGKALELKSQLYASIGIMAGSYAHNIKNLLVRPNDLLARCLEADALPALQARMVAEVRQTLGTVTQRLQQILQTIRRDPSQSELSRLDLAVLVREIAGTWEELAGEKWKLDLQTEIDAGPLWIQADHSHIQQAIENLIFNARDATFEMRTCLREEARRDQNLPEADRRRALIAAAAWKGRVVLRARPAEGGVLLEVEDNGIGMTEEVRSRSTETHFSTKRNNAIYEGNNTGMGLGLSFVAVILEHHHATLVIDSQPRQGARFRIQFPAAAVGKDQVRS